MPEYFAALAVDATPVRRQEPELLHKNPSPASSGRLRETFENDLVLSYLREVHSMERTAVEAAIADNPDPADALLAIAGSIAQSIQSPGFRGCAFLNAAAEYPATDQPVHQEIIAHRQWFLDTLTTLMAQVHRETADAAARHFVMLRDGAMAAGCLFDPALVAETFLRGIEGLLRINAERQSPQSAD